MLRLVVIVLSTLGQSTVGQSQAEEKCAPEGSICHFLTVPCCPSLTCIRFTRTSGMNGICMLDVHSGDEYSVPLFSTPQGRNEKNTPTLPPNTRFTVPPSPTAPSEYTNPATLHPCCYEKFTCSR